MTWFGRSLRLFCCPANDFGVTARPRDVDGGGCKLGIAECKLQIEYPEAVTAGDHHSSFFNLQLLLRNLQWPAIWREFDNLVPALMLADGHKRCGYT